MAVQYCYSWKHKNIRTSGERLKMPSFRNRKEDEWKETVEKRRMEGRGVFVKKRKKEKEENYQEYCQRREQEEKVRKEKEKLKKEKEKKERYEQSFSCSAESSPKSKKW